MRQRKQDLAILFIQYKRKTQPVTRIDNISTVIDVPPQEQAQKQQVKSSEKPPQIVVTTAPEDTDQLLMNKKDNNGTEIKKNKNKVNKAEKITSSPDSRQCFTASQASIW